MSNKYKLSAATLGLFMLSAVIFLPGIQGPFALDSIKLYSIQDQLLHNPEMNLTELHSSSSVFGRKLSIMSFGLNISLDGKLIPSTIKLSNVLIHLINTVLVYFFCRQLFKLGDDHPLSDYLAFFIASIWCITPVNINCVLYAIQRMAQLATLFSLLSLMCYISARNCLRVQSFSKAILYGCLSIGIFLPLAALSKETGLLIPLYIAVIELYFFRHTGFKSIRSKCLLIASVLIVAVLVVFLLSSATELLNYDTRSFTLGERLLSESRVLSSYIAKILLPLSGDPAIFSDDFLVSRSWLAPPDTLLAIIFIAGMLTLSIALLSSQRFRLTGFGILFFFAGHSMESSIFPLELYFEHRNYLPGFGILFAASTFVWQLFRDKLSHRFWTSLALIIVVYHSLLGFYTSYAWSSNKLLYAQSLRYHPDSARALKGQAQLLFENGNLDEATALLDRLMQLSSKNEFNARIQIIYSRCLLDQAIEPQFYAQVAKIREFETAIETSQALENLLRLVRNNHCRQLDLESFSDALQQILQSTPQAAELEWSFTYYLSNFYFAGGLDNKAFATLKASLNGGNKNAGLFLIDLYMERQQSAEASEVFGTLREKSLLSDTQAQQLQQRYPNILE